jgi:drug/metabolite transporter (DMT)-like permease
MIQSEKTMSLLMVLAMFTWALAAIAAKTLSGYITENEIVVYRYFLAAASMVPILLFMGLSFKIDWKNLALALLIALFTIANARFYFMGVDLGTAGLGAALVTVLIPMIVYLLMLLSKQEQPPLKDWAALIWGGGGVMLMMDITEFGIGELLTGANLYFVMAAFCWALISVSGAWMKGAHVLTFSFYVCLFAFSIDWFLSFDAPLSTLLEMDRYFWISILTVSILSTAIASTIYYVGLRVLGSKKCSTYSLLTPFFAIAMGALFFGESLTLQNATGTLMAVSALFVLQNIKIKGIMPYR